MKSTFISSILLYNTNGSDGSGGIKKGQKKQFVKAWPIQGTSQENNNSYVYIHCSVLN